MIYIPGFDPFLNSNQHGTTKRSSRVTPTYDETAKLQYQLDLNLELYKRRPTITSNNFTCKTVQDNITNNDDIQSKLNQNYYEKRAKSTEVNQRKLHKLKLQGSPPANNNSFIPNDRLTTDEYENDRDDVMRSTNNYLAKMQVISETMSNVDNSGDLKNHYNNMLSTGSREKENNLLLSLKLKDTNLLKKLIPEKNSNLVAAERFLKNLDQKIEDESFYQVRGEEIFERLLRNSKSALKKKQRFYNVKLDELTYLNQMDNIKNMDKCQLKEDNGERLSTTMKTIHKYNESCKQKVRDSQRLITPKIISRQSIQQSRPITSHTNYTTISQKEKAYTSFLDIDIKSSIGSTRNTNSIEPNINHQTIFRDRKSSIQSQYSNTSYDKGTKLTINSPIDKALYTNSGNYSYQIPNIKNTNEMEIGLNEKKTPSNEEEKTQKLKNLINITKTDHLNELNIEEHKAKAKAFKKESTALKNSLYNEMKMMKQKLLQKLGNDWVDNSSVPINPINEANV